MRIPFPRFPLALVLAAAPLAACRGAAQSPAPAAAPPPAAAADTGRAWSAADVRFMQGMIGHHAQALAMTALVPARTTGFDVALLAERIRVSQEGEIALMQQWLAARGQGVPHADGHDHGHGATDGRAAMPGMATPQEMARLDAARGAEFDRLFLELMIRHHQGALTMVAELFATQGSGQEPEVFRMASDVDADQRAEIARMEALLRAASTP